MHKEKQIMIVIFDRKKIMKDANAWSDLMKIREMEKRASHYVPQHLNREAEPKHAMQIPESQEIAQVFSKDPVDKVKLREVKAALRTFAAI